MTAQQKRLFKLDQTKDLLLTRLHSIEQRFTGIFTRLEDRVESIFARLEQMASDP